MKYAIENPIIISLFLFIKWPNGRNISFGDLDLRGQVHLNRAFELPLIYKCVPYL